MFNHRSELAARMQEENGTSELKACCIVHQESMCGNTLASLPKWPPIDFGTRKTEVLNSLIINITAKANDTTDILQTFR